MAGTLGTGDAGVGFRIKTGAAAEDPHRHAAR
jgi:hypothetical protein